MRKLQNFVGGATSTPRTDPAAPSSTRAPARPSPRRRSPGPADVDRAIGRRRDAFAVERDHRLGAQPGADPDRRRPRGPGGGAGRRRVREHRQALAAHHGRGDPAHGRPDPFLRRRRPPARGPVGGGVHGRPHLVRPSRADRGVRCGHALELPDDDGGVEVAPRRSPRATRWCSSRRTPPRSPRCSWPRSWPSTCRPGCSTWSAATVTPAGSWSSTTRPAMVSITGSVRAGMEVAAAAAPTSSASTSSSAARPRSSSSTTPIGRDRRGHRRRRLLQRRAGLHGGDPGPGRAPGARGPARRRWSSRPGQRRWGAPTTTTPTTGR